MDLFRMFKTNKPERETVKQADFGMNQYQAMASEYAEYPKEVAGIYPVLGLASEAGEVAGKIKKVLRGDGTKIDREALISELGDVYWYLAMTAKEYGVPMHMVAINNLQKLQKRKEDGTIKGDGDVR